MILTGELVDFYFRGKCYRLRNSLLDAALAGPSEDTKRVWLSLDLESAAFSAEPEAEIPMLCVAFGVSANFAMVPKFEESARKSSTWW